MPDSITEMFTIRHNAESRLGVPKPEQLPTGIEPQDLTAEELEGIAAVNRIAHNIADMNRSLAEHEEDTQQ